jgi:hypothetical protein
LEKAATPQELAVTKAVSTAEKHLSEAENLLALQKAEQKVRDAAFSESHAKELALKDDLIERYKDMKAKLSVKLISETLEQPCETEFNRVRSLAFPNAEFGKDDDASGSTKGDFVFRDFSDDDVEYISIMFEMKSESDFSWTKNHRRLAPVSEDVRHPAARAGRVPQRSQVQSLVPARVHLRPCPPTRRGRAHERQRGVHDRCEPAHELGPRRMKHTLRAAFVI